MDIIKAIPKKLNKDWEKKNIWGIFVNDSLFLGKMINEELKIFKHKEFDTFEEAEKFIKNHKKLELD